jgi:hypothetical protein
MDPGFQFALLMLIRAKHLVRLQLYHKFRLCISTVHALGLGLYCQSLCRDFDDFVFCQFEPSLRLHDMLPYQHLRRFFRICLVHFKRNIHELRAHITDEVRLAMLSLASTEVHPDIEKAFELIKSGGPKARGSFLQ